VRFAAPLFLFGALLALVVGALLVLGALLLVRARRRFGDDARIAALVTGRTGPRRALKGVLAVLALGLAFLAAAQPQYGRGTRRIPATNLDVAIVLDFSKSMYARDVKPSRIERAKAEVQSLVRELPGGRVAAVAFAGDPIRFPLTSDGGAIAQFFRQLNPNDMPVGGTAIARALSAAQEVLRSDPLAKKHQQVILLVTDGEDLEGDPVSVATSLAEDHVPVHVVQIGGRTPEPIPEVDDEGEVTGYRVDENGQVLTTALSAEGEATLAKIAEAGGGSVVRSASTGTGITEVARRLRRLMTEDLSEKVETVYADVFHLPLGIALLLLLVETFVRDTRRPRRAVPPTAPPPRAGASGAAREVRRAAVSILIGAALVGALVHLGGCDARSDPFVRHAPAVDQALDALDAGDAGAAVEQLQRYLGTGRCEAGEIGAPESLDSRPSAGFDLGLGLFRLGEQFGQRFGEEPADGGAPDDETLGKRGEQVRCALKIVRAIAGDDSVPVELQARAHYLAGNLEFLRQTYRDAVAEYDQALRLIPGLPDAGEDLGSNAAWNRSIALRRIQDQPPDAGADASPDGGDDAGPDAGDDGGADAGADGGGDDGGDDGGAPDAGDSSPDAGGGADAGAPPPDAGGAAPQPNPQDQQDPTQDERTLDQLEEAPTLQQHNAEQRSRQGRMSRSGMADK
jgi:Ca-activated chloride channel family protein